MEWNGAERAMTSASCFKRRRDLFSNPVFAGLDKPSLAPECIPAPPPFHNMALA
jgi:hypothetical protein